MRIGIDARMYGSGFTGIGRYTFELIRHLSALDTHNEYVVFLRKEAFDSFTAPTPKFKKVLADFEHYSLSEQIGFLRALNREHLDLMHFCHFNAPLFYRRPSVVTIHDLTLSFFPGKKMNSVFRRLAYQLVLRSITRKARSIIAVSNHTKQDLIRLLGLPAEKIRVIYNGVSPELATPPSVSRSQALEPLSIRKPYFLYTGVWRDHKNIPGLISAFARLNDESKHAYQLVITGKPNAIYHEIPDTIESLGIQNEVVLTGQIPDDTLRSVYQNALAYVFPSFYEGFGLPPLEAMQCGVPVAASNRSAIPEVCGQGNALFFDPSSVSDMADKMQTIATDETLRSQLISRGRERVRAFDWKRMAEETLEVYHGATVQIPNLKSHFAGNNQ